MKNKQLYIYRSENGFILYQLLDYDGTFYIIHPFENLLKRNIKGKIISYTFDGNEFLKDKLSDGIFTNMLINLNQKNLLVDLKLTSLSFINNEPCLSNYIKTEYINIINDMDEYLNWKEKTLEDVITMLTSKAYDSFDDVLLILTFIKTLKGINNLFINSKIPNNYTNQDNEIELLYNIIYNLKKSFSNFNIFNLKSYKILENKYKYDAEIVVQNFLIDYEQYKLDPPKNKYNVNLWNKLTESYHQGILRKEKGFMKFVKYMINVNDEIYNYRNYKEDIKLWSKTRNIESNMIFNFLDNYVNVLLEVLTIKKDIEPNKNELDPLEKIALESTSFKKSLTGSHELENIIRPFLHGKPYNITLKIKTTDESYKIIPSIFNVINSTKPNKGRILFYFDKSKSLDKKYNFTLNITNKIDIKWLFNILPYYYKSNTFKNEIVKHYNNTYKIYELYGDLYDSICTDITNNWSLHNVPFESTELPVLKEFMKNLKKSI
jgi:hypothetical protein